MLNKKAVTTLLLGVVASGAQATARVNVNDWNRLQGAADTAVSTVPAGKGVLLITGDIGVGQRNSFRVRRCEKDVTYGQKRFSCDLLPLKLSTNQKLVVDPGVYSLHGPESATTGSQRLNINVDDGQQTEIKLARITMPAAAGFTFRAFIDLNVRKEYDKMALGVYSSKRMIARNNEWCTRSDEFSQKVCNAWSSPAALTASAFGTSALGEYLLIRSALTNGTGNFDNWGRMWVQNESPTGGFVAVFPGSYGVQTFYNGQAHTLYSAVEAKDPTPVPAPIPAPVP